MGKSARILGQEFGRTAREMNELLKEHGYLYGEPGAYGLTEKGEQYAQEQHHSRGTGGYAHYNRSWETRTWNDDTAAALRADMAARSEPVEGPAPVAVDTTPDEVLDSGFPPAYPVFDVEEDDGEAEGPPTWPELAITAAVVAAPLVVPHLRPIWDNKVRPATVRLRDKISRKRKAPPAEDLPARDTEAQDR